MNHRFFHTIKVWVFCLCLAGLAPLQAQTGKPFVVALDAGHGGVDPGAKWNRTFEKDVNLKVALKVGKMIRERYKERVKVVYTRSTDVFVELYKRPQIATKAAANLFISFHVNANPKTSPNGVQTFLFGKGSGDGVAAKENSVVDTYEKQSSQYYDDLELDDGYSWAVFEAQMKDVMEKSNEVAQIVQRHLCKKNSSLVNRGVSRDNFLVLREALMPSILVEMGFISNKKDRAYITSDNGINNLSQAIFDAFCEYFEKYSFDSDAADLPDADHSVNETVPVVATPEPVAVDNGDEDVVVYKVQILASEKKLSAKDKQLKGYAANYYREGNLYKYTCGETTSYQEAKKLRTKLAKQFNSPFIVKFKNGKRIK